MKLNKLYKLQEELDKTILENEVKRTGKEIDKDLLLKQTILALQVEVAELANATRCFKHWSTKGAESRERLLDEYADILHFYLSIGNQLSELGHKARMLYIDFELFKEEHKDTKIYSLTWLLSTLLTYTSLLDIETLKAFNEFWKEDIKIDRVYKLITILILLLAKELEFTEEEIEQAYMKKHKENYRRQEEGY